ncbi:hypothetical protein MPTK1_2g21560 [Marchantia polymorpha subsp. ruderalis]|uniref:Uncharacterized protein n=1 Tax=Marchantia polymorpha TaxID=3197 RepID=A0A2R6X2P8_MARPO|nr:hypothetical protein MARPO_0040s0058 [Marchantia polymorpha]BBN03199.1 hypothetical protein Mp_2g21560 [Marchantia polymorpha subsp. ruderalis]|eukprot:PTQ40378.1 hypothetical protein MARPO_0040s0058 [Marchantia polymorpha]
MMLTEDKSTSFCAHHEIATAVHCKREIERRKSSDDLFSGSLLQREHRHQGCEARGGRGVERSGKEFSNDHRLPAYHSDRNDLSRSPYEVRVICLSQQTRPPTTHFTDSRDPDMCLMC